MTTPLTDEELDAARAEQAPTLRVVDDDATVSVCISDGETYLARDCYLWAGDTALHRESLSRITSLVGRHNLVPRLLATIDALRVEERKWRHAGADGIDALADHLGKAQSEVATLKAEVERLTEVVAALRKGATAEMEAHAMIERQLEAEVEVDEPAEEPVLATCDTDTGPACECCGGRLDPGERVASWDGVLAHWGPCPAPDLWAVAWAYNDGDVHARLPARPFEESYARARDCRTHLERNNGNRVRLVRVRKEQP